jgi:hypothetical protein
MPIGFYSSEDLVNHFESMLNGVSPNKLMYKVEIIQHTNKVKMSCATRDAGIPVMFNLSFCDKHLQFNNYSLGELLGFKKKDYYNNNCYVSEDPIIRNAYNDIFMQVIVNGSNVERIKSSNNSFSYFAYIQPDYKCKNVALDMVKEFLFDKEIDIQTLSFQFWNTRNYSITVPLVFNTVLEFCL